jgi:hypothetical protein
VTKRQENLFSAVEIAKTVVDTVIRKKFTHHKREGNKRDVRDAKKQQNSYDHSFYDSTAYHSADAAADY